MTTTIQVSDETKKKLDSLKSQSKKSYDQIVQSLLQKEERLILREQSANYYSTYAKDDAEEVNEFKDKDL